jgi:4-hydroxy-tetrahydrodipicolinate reductase
VEPIRVVVNGALGKMGQEVINAIAKQDEIKLVGAVEKEVTQRYLPIVGMLVYFSSDLDSLLEGCDADVVVDFTNAEASIAAARIAAKRKANLVIGTTGLSEENIAEIDQLCQSHQIGAIVAPNFSLGAVMLTKLAGFAAKFFDYAEIIEMHHDKKADAPSGTAINTAKAMLKTRGKPFIYPKTETEIIRDTRGGQMEGIAIHSLRLPGFMAAQEVIFSGAGQTLSLRNETISREAYMPGVILAIKEVVKRKGLIYGLDSLLEKINLL